MIYEIGQRAACAICCGGRHTIVPDNLLGTVEDIIERPSGPTYVVRLPSGMIEMLYDGVIRPEAPDPSTQPKKEGMIRHTMTPA